MKPKNLIELQAGRGAPDVVLGALVSKNAAESAQAGLSLIADAAELGLDVKDYLRLGVDRDATGFKGSGMDGYEVALSYLNLPLKDDFAKGVVLQAAAETFQTFPGVRALFPAVMDSIVQWKYRQDQIEQVEDIVAQSRTIAGTELITTVINDQPGDYQQFGMVDEGARIAVRSIRATERSVRIHKFGGGYEHTYEFGRRAALDILTPYAARLTREIAIAKVRQATVMLLNGDGVQGTPTAYQASVLGTAIGTPSTPTKMDWNIFLKFLIERAKLMVPIDTIVGGYDTHFEWLRMFSAPTVNFGPTQMEILAKAGVETAIASPRFNFNVKFAVSSAMPAATLVGFSKNDTLEELVESGSDITESERSIKTQKMTYTHTENCGYRLVFPDTRATLVLN